MVKKRVQAADSTPVQRPLDPEWEDRPPEVVAEAVDGYLRAMRQKNKFTEQTRVAKERALELMKEHGIEKLRIDEGKQWLEVEHKDNLRTRKVKLEKDDTRQSARA
jgi:cell division protein ZapA (FtsZ GTPase activity inhibitor)